VCGYVLLNLSFIKDLIGLYALKNQSKNDPKIKVH
jgi:hypothetical protein